MENNLRTLDYVPSPLVLKQIERETKNCVKIISKHARDSKISAQIFLGGSYAKGTMVEKKSYDIDIFIRIEKKNFAKDISSMSKVAEKVAKDIGGKLTVVHGSRDYYQIQPKSMNAVFEIIPVLKIKKPEEAENVTDLSYFHVAYIKKKLSKKMQREVRLAKAFFDACGCYGAESYIQGFSGYATECLIAAYGSLNKMLKMLTKEGKIIVDPARHYRNPKEALIELNEAKLQSPIIVIDPTWKKRNALASLSEETYLRFVKHAKTFMKNPSVKHFEKKEVSKEDLVKQATSSGQDFAEITLKTDRQEGDIAGTKMKKASRFIVASLEKYFKLTREEFKYDLGQSAQLYLVAKPMKEILLAGPPVKMKKHADAFRKEHDKIIEKKGRLYAVRKNESSLKEYLQENILGGKEIRSMGITSAEAI